MSVSLTTVTDLFLVGGSFAVEGFTSTMMWFKCILSHCNTPFKSL